MDERLRLDTRMERGEPKAAAGHNHMAGHNLTVVNREQVNITGVLHVDSFDDREIILETHLGSLVLRGEDLHIKQLDLETGDFVVSGLLHATQYGPSRRGRQGSKQAGKGLFERLLR